ncbi:MAG: efflux transporter outer membrane subunit [Syntrophobacter sp.]
MRGFIYPLVVVLLAGCMVGPDYRRPTVDVPRAFQYQVSEARETGNTLWWKQFDDPVLDDLIAEALVNSKNVQIAAATIEQAQGVLTQTRAPLFPQLNYTGTGTRERASEMGATSIASVPNPQTSYQLLAGANWELDLWGKVRRQTEAARANLFASEEARRGVILSLVASVAASYLQLVGLDEQLVIANRTLETYAESVKLFELQFKHGQVSQMNVAQARSQYETAAATIPQLESQIAQTEIALSILLGRNPGPIKRGKSIFTLSPPAIPAGLPSQVLERRPDIAQAEQNLVAANAQIGAAKALYFPTISLTGTLGTSSSELENLFKGPARVWSYAGSITGPIFNAGLIAGQVKQAEAGRKIALLSYESAIQNAFGDVEKALVSCEKLVDQLKAQGLLVEALKEYAQLARLQYQGGYVTYLTVLDAEQQLFPAELNYASTRSSLLASYVKLYQAMGGGWVVEAEKLTSETQPAAVPPFPITPQPEVALQPAAAPTTATVP